MSYLSNVRTIFASKITTTNASVVGRAKCQNASFHSSKPTLDWSNRMQAIENLHKKKPHVMADLGATNPVDSFGIDVFGDKQMREKLPSSSYEKFKEAVDNGAPLDIAVADQIATAMKEWSMARGATHYTHWFQPLTGTTAEKHDSFMTYSGRAYDRALIMNFAGKELIKGEPDASSFPSGGIRSTFEARGYTAWDMSSPSFIRRGANGPFLCIPTAFCSWTGEALDQKTPLLRSNEAISKAATRLCHLLGETNVSSVSAELGVEQEFFLIDRGFFYLRPDLLACGRSLLGTRPPKGQELEDHYFGALDRRVLAFLQEAEWVLWKLGVPMKTRHNEVAPSQYEMAPIFEDISVACDHNMLAMEVIREVAVKHGMACLLHEKPFAGVNGSGKHNNWSISTNTGENLCDPGNTPAKNARFMVFLSALLRAVKVHGDLLRIGVTTPGNDHRLGANEAPPAIMAVFSGHEIARVIEDIVSPEHPSSVHDADISKKKDKMKLGVNALPSLPKDATDRNRTSPVAFTGNKFEFRAVGSSQNSARPGMMMNAIVTDSVNYVADHIEAQLKEGKSRQEAVHNVVSQVLKENYGAVYNGNNYSDEWVKEAAKRGLWNLRTTPEAIQQLASQKNVDLFKKTGILSEKEVHAHQDILYESYCKALNVEAQCLLDMASTGVLPAALQYQHSVSNVASNVKTQPFEGYFSTITGCSGELIKRIGTLKKRIAESESFKENQLHEKATFMRGPLTDAMGKTREICDELETLIDNKVWPFPKYSEMLFMK